MLIHYALHPVAAMAIASARMSRMFDLELSFIFLLGSCKKRRWSLTKINGGMAAQE